MGKEVEANVAISKGMVTINFPKPVAPNECLKVTLSGVKMDHQGGTALYRVSAIQTGLVGTIPIGTAMVRLLDSSS
jgi:acyl dehydratase